ncbi:MAG TPA: Na+/H+ antiporter [Candidatus Elarobacter sp.]|nr:Na+/H+ antiporter [Candidatus Elarobacter sp.]
MIDFQAGLLIALLALAVPLVALAKRLNVSYPIALVIGGLVLGFVPGLPKIQLDPTWVLLIFLPPLLYWEAITAPTDIMWDNRGQIAALAFGLVVVTTVAVAILAHAIVPGMSWGAAFVLGAIISPTDELAAVPVLERFRLPRHVIAIVDGESLLNDAASLVIYATALAVVTTGQFGAASTAMHFAIAVVGSVVLGLAAGWLAVAMWRRIKDPELQGAISLVLPFLAYFPAQYFQLSGVLAVVTAGVYASRMAPRVLTPESRRQTTGFWNTLVFVANAVLFLVVGLQLHDVAANAFANYSWQFVLGVAVAANALVLIVRFAFVIAAEYLPIAAPPDHAAPDWRNALVVAWSGLRGAISLAAALAIPFALPSGARFPHRDLIVFVTFTVILVTLVGGGLSLPAVVRVLHIRSGNEEDDETRDALLQTYEAALNRIAELEHEGRLDAAHAQTMRQSFEHRREVQQKAKPDRIAHLDQFFDAERDVIAVQRDVLLALRDSGDIDNVVFRRLQSQLDTHGQTGVAT